MLADLRGHTLTLQSCLVPQGRVGEAFRYLVRLFIAKMGKLRLREVKGFSEGQVPLQISDRIRSWVPTLPA